MAITPHFVRHLPSDYNRCEIMTGGSNPPLVEGALDSIDATIDVIESWRVDRIISPETDRHKLFAEAINRRLGISIIYDDKLGERRLGKLEGLPYSAVDTEGYTIQPYLARISDPNSAKLVSPYQKQQMNSEAPVETRTQVRQRVIEVLNEKLWYPGVPDNERTLWIVSELWYDDMLNVLFGNVQGPVMGTGRLLNGHYSIYTILFPTKPRKRFTIQEAGNVPFSRS